METTDYLYKNHKLTNFKTSEIQKKFVTSFNNFQTPFLVY